jgi:two-component system, OmpR family, alkaline phosphatase synthesis response regulator PhoP
MRLPKVLVVDDDDAIRLLVATILRREHCYDVETASGGLEALSKMLLTHYDVIVLDLMMPIVGGADVLDALALRDPLHKCVVLMSAASPIDVAASVTPNVCVILRKPFDIDAVVNAVKGCVVASSRPVVPPNGNERLPPVSRAA